MQKLEADLTLPLRAGLFAVTCRERDLTKAKLKDAHRRIMLANHPDRIGGSAYLSSKINEAKDLLEKQVRV